MSINEEAVNDRAKLLMHRIVARMLPSNPHLISQARSALSPEGPAPSYVGEWNLLLEANMTEVRRMITVRSEMMDRLRISSPFSFVIDFRDPTLRRRIWKLARKGISRSSKPDSSDKFHGEICRR